MPLCWDAVKMIYFGGELTWDVVLLIYSLFFNVSKIELTITYTGNFAFLYNVSGSEMSSFSREREQHVNTAP